MICSGWLERRAFERSMSTYRQLHEMSARRQLHLLAPRGVFHAKQKILIRLTRNLSHVKRISFEGACHSNDVADPNGQGVRMMYLQMNISWNASRNQDKEWRRKFRKGHSKRGFCSRGSEERFLHRASRLVRGRTRGKRASACFG